MSKKKKEDTKQSVTLFGYSERGVINSLCHEIGWSDDCEIVRQLVNTITLPFRQGINHIELDGIKATRILVEQSLSGFGDPDVVLLLEQNNKEQDQGHCIFIEAKVRTEQNERWSIYKDIKAVRKRLNGEEKSDGSNIFTQLYLKQLLINNLSKVESEHLDDDNGPLQDVKCPPFCHNGRRKKGGTWTPGSRSIGTNTVVLGEVRSIHAFCNPDGKNIYYAALVPAKRDRDGRAVDIENVMREFKGCLEASLNSTTSSSSGFNCNFENWGYTTWADIGDLIACNISAFPTTARILLRNDRQISDHLGKLKEETIKDGEQRDDPSRRD